MRILSRGLLALLCMPVVACSPTEGEPDTVYRENDAPVAAFSTDDTAMNRAMQQARSTLDEYRRRLTTPPATQTDLSLKARFESGGEVEHMWINDVEIIDGGFRGKLGNTPLHIESLQLEDTVEVPASHVSDWMAIDDGRLVGGYTLRVVRDRMSTEERRTFDAQMGFRID